MSKNVNIEIWDNLLKQGVDPKSVLKMACDHEGDLDALPQSEERDVAIKNTVVFIKKLSKIVYGDENESA